MDNFDVVNFMEVCIDDQISCVSGVGNIQLIGQEYVMCIWLDLEKMWQYVLMLLDIEIVLQVQNIDVLVGELGGQLVLKGQQLDVMVIVCSCLYMFEQFVWVVFKVDVNGSVVYLGDVVMIGLGLESYDSISIFNGKLLVLLGIEFNVGVNVIVVFKVVEV